MLAGCCCPTLCPPPESNLASSCSIRSKIPAGCRKSVCPSVQVLNTKLVQVSEMLRQSSELRTDLEEAQRKGKWNIFTFNMAASQYTHQVHSQRPFRFVSLLSWGPLLSLRAMHYSLSALILCITGHPQPHNHCSPHSVRSVPPPYLLILSHWEPPLTSSLWIYIRRSVLMLKKHDCKRLCLMFLATGTVIGNVLEVVCKGPERLQCVF